jgi:hypothetical protein
LSSRGGSGTSKFDFSTFEKLSIELPAARVDSELDRILQAPLREASRELGIVAAPPPEERNSRERLSRADEFLQRFVNIEHIGAHLGWEVVLGKHNGHEKVEFGPSDVAKLLGWGSASWIKQVKVLHLTSCQHSHIMQTKEALQRPHVIMSELLESSSRVRAA